MAWIGQVGSLFGGKIPNRPNIIPWCHPPKKRGFLPTHLMFFFFWGGVLLRKRALKGGTPLDSHDIKAARILCCFMFFLAGSKIPPTKQICCSDLEAAAGAGCLTWPRCRESALRDVRSQRTRGVEGVGNRVKPSWSQVDGRPFQHSPFPVFGKSALSKTAG